MNGVVVMRSVESFDVKPAICSVGGFSALSEDGRSYSFDWDSHQGNITFADGHFLVTWELGDVSEDFTEMNDEQGVTDADITPDFIAKSTLEEVHYECYMKVSDELTGAYTALELVSFAVFSDDREPKFVPDEKVAEFNVLLREQEKVWTEKPEEGSNS
jgi:prepilin-type processing-associated H-X9-DG protein